MEERRGISDLMDRERYRPPELKAALIKNLIPGKWESIQNVYNLISAKVMPRDTYVFIFLSEFLSIDLKELLLRYSNKETGSESAPKEEIDIFGEEWE